jgi:hypothetical protein
MQQTSLTGYSCSLGQRVSHILFCCDPLRRRRSAVAAIRRTTVATAHTHRVLGSHTAILVDSCGRSDFIISSRVDTNRNPSHDTIGDVVRKLDPLDERIHVCGFLAQNLVVGVESGFLRVGVVGRGGFDEGDEVLVEEDLADVGGVRGRVAAEEGAVGADGGVVGVVGEDVDVGGACGWGLVYARVWYRLQENSRLV